MQLHRSARADRARDDTARAMIDKRSGLGRRVCVLAIAVCLGTPGLVLATAAPSAAAPYYPYPQNTVPFSGLNGPEQIAVDSSGDLFLADFGSSRVLELPAGSTSQVTLPFTGLAFPTGVAVDSAGDVFVAGTGNNKVFELPKGSTTMVTLPFTGLSQPRGLAVDSAGDVFVADSFNSRILELPAGSTTQITLPFTGLGAGGAWGVAVDPAGDVFVGDGFNNRVLELPKGSTTQITVPFTGLNTPVGLAIDPGGDLFVGDTGNHRVLELPAGSSTQVTLPFTGLNVPQWPAIDSAGDAFISDTGASQVQELRAFHTSGSIPPSPPYGLVLSDGPITLNWNAPTSPGVPPVSSYEVFRFTQSTAASLIATVTGTSYVDSNVVPGTTYSYYVEAQNAVGTSAPSNVVSITDVNTSQSAACSGDTGNTAFLCAAYVDLLDRAPDAAGQSSWLAALSQGTSRTQVAYDIATSNEYRTDLVNGWYQSYLGRSADPGGIATWVGQMAAGASDQAVQAGLLGSGEFYADSTKSAGATPGSTPASSFVNALYEVLLGRPADPGGLSIWEGQLASGATPTSVAAAILGSNEYLTDFVQDQYSFLLGRPADPGGLSTWGGQLSAGAPCEAVTAGIVGSAEYYTDSQST